MARRPLRKADITCLELFGQGNSNDGNLVGRLVFLLSGSDVGEVREEGSRKNDLRRDDLRRDDLRREESDSAKLCGGLPIAERRSGLTD